MDLDSMKYGELRSLAKQLGLKANVKADKLLKAIKQHYQQEKGEERQQGPQEDAGGPATQEDENTSRGGGVPVFVNTRRGKGAKRRISGAGAAAAAAAEGDAESQPTTDEGDGEVAADGESDAKKRRVSSDADQELPAATGSSEQQQQDVGDEAATRGDAGNPPNVAKAGKIPRYKGLQKKKASLKPVTPNFKKLHEAHFDKMESIDSYVQRKTKQMESLRNSVKELKVLSDQAKQQRAGRKTQARANPSRASMFSPAPESRDKRRVTVVPPGKAPQSKPAGKEAAPFRPSVLSTRRINVRFSEATFDNEHKKSLVKTPARMSLCAASSTPQSRPSIGGKANSVRATSSSAKKTPGPFVFTGSTGGTPGTHKKPSFDLKASLSRPLSYKPHAGKLKPFVEAKENAAAANKSLISNPHQTNYKQHQVQTREDRRAKRNEDRKQKKQSLLGARRGLVMM